MAPKEKWGWSAPILRKLNQLPPGRLAPHIAHAERVLHLMGGYRVRAAEVLGFSRAPLYGIVPHTDTGFAQQAAMQ